MDKKKLLSWPWSCATPATVVMLLLTATVVAILYSTLSPLFRPANFALAGIGQPIKQQHPIMRWFFFCEKGSTACRRPNLSLVVHRKPENIWVETKRKEITRSQVEKELKMRNKNTRIRHGWLDVKNELKNEEKRAKYVNTRLKKRMGKRKKEKKERLVTRYRDLNPAPFGW